jgi:hypothetical protein
LVFGTNSVDQVTLNNNGNLGIGTTNPSNKLDVSGNINYSGTLTNNGLKSGGMVLLETREVTSSIQYVDFPDIITSDYDMYKIIVSNLTCSNDNTEPEFVLSNNNGSSYQFGSGYGSVGFQDQRAHTFIHTNLNRHPLLAWSEADNGNNSVINGHITLCNPTNTNIVTSIYSTFIGVNDADVIVECKFHTYRNVKQNDNAFRIFMNIGNILTCKISVYGFVR